MVRQIAVLGLAFLASAAGRDEFKPELSGITIQSTFKKNTAKGKEFLEIIKTHRETAVKTIYDTLGIKEKITAKLILSDTVAMKGAVALTNGFGTNVTITFGVEPLIQQQWSKTDLEQTLAHELVHAHFRNHLTQAKYDKYHKWIKEGIAVFGADQIEYRARRLEKKGKTVDRLANGLESGKHSTDDYAEDGLAFEYIRKKYGADKVKQFAAQMKQGKDYKQIVKDLTAEDFQAFLGSAKSFTQDYFKNLKPE